jgi:hypothetical protein
VGPGPRVRQAGSFFEEESILQTPDDVNKISTSSPLAWLRTNMQRLVFSPDKAEEPRRDPEDIFSDSD